MIKYMLSGSFSKSFSRFSALLFFILFLIGISKQSYSQAGYRKTSYTSFRYNNTTVQNLYVRGSGLYEFSCSDSPQPQTQIKKSTLVAKTDWKGDYQQGATTSYSVVLNIKAYSTYSGTSGLITTFTPTLVLNTNQPQSYNYIDVTGIYPTANRFEITPSYVRSGTAISSIESVMTTEVYYTEDFDYDASSASTLITLNPVSNYVVDVNNVMTFSWYTNCSPAPNYQIQILKLFNTAPTNTTTESVITTDVDWNNALTIETGNSLNQISLTLAEGNGYYVWRVRPIGNVYPGGVADPRNWGLWSNHGALTQGATNVYISSATSPYLFYYNQFDDNLNWIFTRNFVEGDAVTGGQINFSESMNYANGLQMARQQQVRLMSEGKALVNQTIYDNSGRAAINTLPAPVLQNYLKYIPSYVKNTSGQPYTAADFDADGNYKDPAIMDSTANANGLNSPSNYYSSSGTLDGDVPSASGYPYSRTLFSMDGTNKPREKSSPGYYHRLSSTGTKHTTRTYYSGVADIELIKVFGDEAPYENSVYKTVNMDANNVTSVSYISKEGKTIATCLSTPTVSNLDPIPSSTVAALTVTSNINNNNSSYTPYGYRSFKSVAFSQPTNLVLNYSVTPNSYGDNCSNFCATCDYTVTLKVTDNSDPSGTPVYTKTVAIPSTSATANCSATAVSSSTTLVMNPGEYTVERIILSNNTNTNSATGNSYINSYIQTIKNNLSNAWATGTGTLVTDAGVNVLTGGGQTFTVSMTTFNSYVNSYSLTALYTLLNAQTGDTHKNIKVGCNTIRVPVWFCDSHTCTGGDLDFEGYFINWFHQKYPSDASTNQQILDKLFSHSVRAYQVGEFNVVIQNMLNCGSYNCQKLWDCWKSVIAAYESESILTGSYTNSSGQSVSSANPDYLDDFLSCAGYKISTITSYTGSLSSSGCGSPGYYSHPYAYIQYPTACSICEEMFCKNYNSAATSTCVGTFSTNFNSTSITTVTISSSASDGTATSATTTNKNKFFECIKSTPSGSCNPTAVNPPNCPSVTDLTNACKNYCESRYESFVTSIVKAYHDNNNQVMGDPYYLVADSEFGGYTYGTTTYTPTGSEISYATIYCEADAMVEACKSKCSITTQTSSTTFTVGTTAEIANIANVMSGKFSITLPTSGTVCPSGYTVAANTTYTSSIKNIVLVLNQALPYVRNSAPQKGVYWDFRAFLDAANVGFPRDCGNKSEKAFVHPDFPSYFDYESNGTGGYKLVYYFNKAQNAQGVISPKPVYSPASVSTGTFTYTSSGTKQVQNALSENPMAYIFNSTFLPVMTSGAVTDIDYLTNVLNGNNGSFSPITLSTSIYSYTNSPSDYGYWKSIICDAIPSTSLSTSCPICYTLTPAAASPTAEVVTFSITSCSDQTIKDIQNTVNNQINKIINAGVDSLKIRYNTACIKNLTDNFIMSYTLNYHHYTLYYYDRAGNLVKTVPPKGVESLGTPPSDRLTHPAYTFITEYEYNSLGQLIRQKTPDGGESTFTYDAKGKLRFSQNAKQLAATPNPKYSYTKYDALARIVEVGEIALATPPSTVNVNTLNYPSSGGTDITGTVYSTAGPYSYYGNKPQRYLQNRVSYSFTDKDGNFATTNDAIYNFYSYDPHGNVEWLIQFIPELGFNYIAYEYDLISGSVIKVRYNEQFADKFFHRYTYDVDKRIKTVETSRDGFFWEKDADYQYYLHGPLKRKVIGQDKIQGVDYLYTVNGWLKAMNIPGSYYDSGGDGFAVGDNMYVARDAYSMVLGYFKGDYLNRSSVLNPNLGTISNPLNLTARDLFNGNISFWYQNQDDKAFPSGAAVTYSNQVNGRTFKYDQLNRITEANYNLFSTTTLSWSASSDFYEKFSYDANGNILTLRRDGISTTNLNMDNMTYNYGTTDNKLTYVTDAVASGNYSTDIDNQSSGNYSYDQIGNLTADASGGLSSIAWNVYGKISQITKSNGNTISYLYDPAGNRVYKKQVNGASPLNEITDYYAKDASGNNMAVYQRTNSGTAPNYTATYTLKEQAIYGSDRLGVRTDAITRTASFTTGGSPQPQLNPIAQMISGYGQMMLPLMNTTKKQIYYADILSASTSTSSVDMGTTAHVLNMSSLTTNTTITFDIGRAQAMAYDDAGNTVLSVYSYTTSNGSIVPSGLMMYLKDTINVSLPSAMSQSVNPNCQAMFLKDPGADDQYYLFTIGKDGKPYYHLINASMGTVVSYNNLMDDNTTYGETMALYEDKTGQGPTTLYMRRFNSGDNSTYLRLFNITATGVAAKTETLIAAGTSSLAPKGDIEISGQGTKLAIANNTSTQGELYMYDLSTDHQTITSKGKLVYGTNNYARSVEFGADGTSYLFFTVNNGTTTNLQRVLGSAFTSSTTTLSLAANTQTMHTQTSTSTVASIVKGGNSNIYYLVNTTGGNNCQVNMYTAPQNAAIGTASVAVNKTISALSTGAFSTKAVVSAYQLLSSTMVANSRVLDKKEYELKDHLGNVHASVKDYKLPWSGTNDVMFDERFDDGALGSTPVYTITTGSPGGTTLSNVNNAMRLTGTNGSATNKIYTLTANKSYMLSFDYDAGTCAQAQYSITGLPVNLSGSLVSSGRKNIIFTLPVGVTTANMQFTCKDANTGVYFNIDNMLIKQIATPATLTQDVNETFSSASPYWVANNTTITYPSGVMNVAGTTSSGSAYRQINTLPGQMYKIVFTMANTGLGSNQFSFGFDSNDGASGYDFIANIGTTAGTYTYYAIAKTSVSTINFAVNYVSGTNYSFTIDNVIVEHVLSQVKSLYTAVYNTFQDYYSFGSPMPNRTYTPNAYRYGMNGQEKDDEIVGSGNHYSATHWEYDSRLGRRWNVDPMFKKYAFKSPYMAFSDNPILKVDPNGDDDYYFDRKGNIIQHVENKNPDQFFIARKVVETSQGANGKPQSKEIVVSDFKIESNSNLGVMARTVYAEMGNGSLVDKRVVAESIRNRMYTKERSAKGETVEDVVTKAYDVTKSSNAANKRYSDPESIYKKEYGGTDAFLESMKASINAIYSNEAGGDIGNGVTSYNSSSSTIYDKNKGYVKIDLPTGADKVKGMWSFKVDAPKQENPKTDEKKTDNSGGK